MKKQERERNEEKGQGQNLCARKRADQENPTADHDDEQYYDCSVTIKYHKRHNPNRIS